MKLSVYTIGLILLSCVNFLAQAQGDPQSTFLQARQLQQQGKWQEAEPLIQRLAAYPLQQYLRYYQMNADLAEQPLAEVQQFIKNNPSRHLNNQLQRNYLLALAKAENWQDFLSFYPKLPNSQDLQCYHYYALAQTGKTADAWAGAKRLWLNGKSVANACDGLFKAWKQTEHFTQQLLWDRSVLALQAGHLGLGHYLLKPLRDDMGHEKAQLLEAYRHPLKYQAKVSKLPTELWEQQVLLININRLIKVDLEAAYQAWRNYGIKLPKSQLATDVEYVLLRSLLFSVQNKQRSEQILDWIDPRLLVHKSEKLLGIRLRHSIAEQDWQDIYQWYPKLPSAMQSKERWRYWMARSQIELGEHQQSKQILSKLAYERSYYGFLAAQHLQQQQSMREQSMEASQQVYDRFAATLKRIHELRDLDMQREARTEWIHLIQSVKAETGLVLGHYALEQGWDGYSVQAAIINKQWDFLALRFPLGFQEHFASFAKKRDIEMSLLYAVARQESALHPHAVSAVGAKGLMQLMPYTAKATAKKIGFNYTSERQLLNPEVNIRLGSAYLGELLETYQGNRILASAAYNAGPSRVNSWLNKRGDVDVDIWVETIPFKETRFYVQSVLAYQLIYQHRLQQELPQLFRNTELDYPYGGSIAKLK